MNIRKKIELTRIGNILIYFATNTKFFGVTKANKLFYYADCYHLQKSGRKITNDIYKSLPEGPVPSEIYDRIKSVIEQRSRFEDLDLTEDIDKYAFLSEFIDIDFELLSTGTWRYTIIPNKEFESKWFSKSEISVLEEVVKDFKDSTSQELSNKTHLEEPYMQSELNEEVNLNLYLKDKLSSAQLEDVEYIERISKAMDYNCK